MPSDLHTLFASQLGTPPVWSLVVTLFGDFSQSETAEIPGTVLSKFAGAFGIRREALRVALHRLKQDGWIDAQKQGRTALYRLSAKGLEETRRVSPMIYSPVEDLPEDWRIVMTQAANQAEKQQLERLGFRPIAPRLFAGHSGLTPPKDSAQFSCTDQPNWLTQLCVSDQSTLAYSQLLAAYMILKPDCTPQTPLEQAALRLMIVHHWRRLVLRHPFLPPRLTGADWPGHLCRCFVQDWLTTLPRPELTKLG